MPGNIYDRRMFRMANGGMMPPMAAGPPMQPAMPPQGALPPELAAMMGGGGGQPPLTDPSQLPPEVLQMADTEMDAAIGEVMDAEMAAVIGEETAAGIAGLESASDIREMINAVWDDNLTLDEYRSELAAVVGAEDATQTPDSVLALVQPTLKLAQLDQGIGAMMQEELGELGGAVGGIANMATATTKSALTDGVAAETEALVNAVGGMSGGQPPMMMEESVGMLAAGPGGMEDVTETMVTGPYA